MLVERIAKTICHEKNMKTSVKPDFYLSSSESTRFCDVRTCYFQGLVEDEIRDFYLLVRIEPAVKDPETGGGVS